MLAARCPSCESLVKVPGKYSGQKVQCPGCHEEMLVVRLLPMVGYSDLEFATNEDTETSTNGEKSHEEMQMWTETDP